MPGTCRSIFFAAIMAANALAADSISARDHLNQGVNAFKTGDYARAADEFRLAIDADPGFSVARLYLATAYQQQFVPGVETAENKKYWQSAADEFQNVLNGQPSASDRLLATQSLASLWYLAKDLPTAAEWNKRVLDLDPNNKEAYYTLGVLAWLNFLPADRAARSELGMTPQQQSPLAADAKGKTLASDLKAKYWQSLTEGIDDETKALAIDPQYENAMSYQNLLIRYRADLDDTQEAYNADIREADAWMGKALAAMKAKTAKNVAASEAGPPTPSQH